MEEEDVKKLMEGEIDRFIKVWITAVLSISYCYFAGKLLPKGRTRLAAVTPAVLLFLFLPLQLNTVHLCGFTAFFLTWLANFKLLMFAVDAGPLAARTSLPRFVAVACFPIKLREKNRNPPRKDYGNGGGPGKMWSYAVKGVLLGFLVKIYDYRVHLNPRFMMVLYSLHIYLGLEIVLAILAAVAAGLFAVELEPQFNEPYLSNSLQDFWGRRWNIMVTRILRPTVYNPVRDWCRRFIGGESASLPAVMATFVVSGVMHELIFYYLGRRRPTWEVTWFFVLHGACLVVEITVKKAVNVDGRFRIPTAVSTVLTIGFVMVTGFWLFFPPFLRFMPVERGLPEIAAVGAVFKTVFQNLNVNLTKSS